MCITGSFSISRDWHNAVNQLYFNKNLKTKIPVNWGTEHIGNLHVEYYAARKKMG